MRRFSLTGCFPSISNKPSRLHSPPSLPAPPNPLPKLISPKKSPHDCISKLPVRNLKCLKKKSNNNPRPVDDELSKRESSPSEHCSSRRSISPQPTVAESVTRSEFDGICEANSPHCDLLVDSYRQECGWLYPGRQPISTEAEFCGTTTYIPLQEAQVRIAIPAQTNGNQSHRRSSTSDKHFSEREQNHRRWSVCAPPETSRVARAADAWERFFKPNQKTNRIEVNKINPLTKSLDSESGDSYPSSSNGHSDGFQINRKRRTRSTRTRRKRNYTLEQFTLLNHLGNFNENESFRHSPTIHRTPSLASTDFSNSFNLIIPVLSDTDLSWTMSELTSSTLTVSGNRTPTDEYPGVVSAIPLDDTLSHLSELSAQQLLPLRLSSDDKRDDDVGISSCFRQRSVSTSASSRPCSSITTERHRISVNNFSDRLVSSAYEYQSKNNGPIGMPVNVIGSIEVINGPIQNGEANIGQSTIVSNKKLKIIRRATIPTLLRSETLQKEPPYLCSDQNSSARLDNISDTQRSISQSIIAVKLNQMKPTDDDLLVQSMKHRLSGIYKRDSTHNPSTNKQTLCVKQTLAPTSPSISPASQKYEQHVKNIVAQRHSTFQNAHIPQRFHPPEEQSASRSSGSVQEAINRREHDGHSGKVNEVEHMDPDLWREKLYLISKWQQEVNRAMELQSESSSSTSRCSDKSPIRNGGLYEGIDGPFFENVPYNPPLLCHPKNILTTTHAFKSEDCSTSNSNENASIKFAKLPHNVSINDQSNQIRKLSDNASPFAIRKLYLTTSSSTPSGSQSQSEHLHPTNSRDTGCHPPVEDSSRPTATPTPLRKTSAPVRSTCTIQPSPRRYLTNQTEAQPPRIEQYKTDNSLLNHVTTIESEHCGSRFPLVTLRDIQLPVATRQQPETCPIYEGMENWPTWDPVESVQWTRVPAKSQQPPQISPQSSESLTSPNDTRRRINCSNRGRRRSVTRLELSVSANQQNKPTEHRSWLPNEHTPRQRSATTSPVRRQFSFPVCRDERSYRWPTNAPSSGFVSAASIAGPVEGLTEDSSKVGERGTVHGRNTVNGLPPVVVTNSISTNRTNSSGSTQPPIPRTSTRSPIAHKFRLGRSASDEDIYIETETPFALTIAATANEISITKLTPAGSAAANGLNLSTRSKMTGQSVPVRLRLSFGSESNLLDLADVPRTVIDNSNQPISDPIRVSLPCIPREIQSQAS